MRLLEIIDLKRKTKHVPLITRQQIKKEKQETEATGLRGAYGGGEFDPKDPHFFNKKVFQPYKDKITDPYHDFILKCSKYAASNPFLPRVYNVTTEVDPNNYKRPTYKIESLVNFTFLTTNMLIAIGKSIDPVLKMLINNKIRDYQNNNFDSDRWSTTGGTATTDTLSLKEAVANVIAEYITTLIEYQKTKSKNQQLQQAVDIIIDLLKQNKKAWNDVHSYNFMFRRTPAGAQLVITDPLASERPSNF